MRAVDFSCYEGRAGDKLSSDTKFGQRPNQKQTKAFDYVESKCIPMPPSDPAIFPLNVLSSTCLVTSTLIAEDPREDYNTVNVRSPIGESPKGIIRSLREFDNADYLLKKLDRLEQHWMPRLLGRRAVKEELVRDALNLPPLARRGLLEVLFRHDETAATDIACEACVRSAKSNVLDTFAAGCIGILRMSLPSDEKTEVLRVALTSIVSSVLAESTPTIVERQVRREAILGLSVYGEVSDVDLILDVIESDRHYDYGDQVAAALRMLLWTFPSTIPDPALKRLRTLCGSLLDDWTRPRVLAKVDMFVQASQTISVLCARLETADLSVAHKAVKKAGNKSLADRMLRYIELSRERLELRGHTEWLDRHASQVHEIEEDLVGFAV